MLCYFIRKSLIFDKNSTSCSRQLKYLQNYVCFSHLTGGGDRFLVGKMQFFRGGKNTSILTMYKIYNIINNKTAGICLYYYIDKIIL